MESEFALHDQQEKLAHAFLEEFLRGAGFSFDTLGQLPAPIAKALMVKASVYASVKLTEIEDRAQMMHSLHHVTEAG